jgi:hypothetical protein
MLAPICGALCAGTIHEFLFCEQEATLISKYVDFSFHFSCFLTNVGLAQT